MNHKFQMTETAVSDRFDERRKRLADCFPDLAIIPRRRFVMTSELSWLVLHGRKFATVRFERGAVELVVSQHLPLFEVHRPGSARCEPQFVTNLFVSQVRYLKCKHLSDEDAHADGFQTKDELIDALRSFYGRIDPDEILSVYAINVSRTAAQRNVEMPELNFNVG